ncbi:hypothetical protein D3C79_908560 [compost metagenome]
MWQTVNIMRTEDHIHESMLRHNSINYAFLLRHAATHAQQKTWLLNLQVLKVTKLSKHLILGVLANRTSI